MLSKRLYIEMGILVNAWYWDYSQLLVLTDPSLLVNYLTLHQSRVFSLHWSNDLLANLQTSWFCLNLSFKSVGIILVMYFLRPKYNKCIGVSAKSRSSMPNSSFCCQIFGPWYSFLSSKTSRKSYFWKATCS